MSDELVIRPMLAQETAHRGRFSTSDAELIQTAFKKAADDLKQTKYSRVSHVSEARHDFKGRFSEIFQANTTTAYMDAHDLEKALRKVAEYVGKFILAAEAEDARRRTANAWVREYKSRSGWEKWWDERFGIEDMPDMEPGTAPVFAPFTPLLGARDIPQGSGGGAGGGTSSARPDKLRSFADNSRSLDDGLIDPTVLQGHLSTFAGTCSWAEIDAEGVIGAYTTYLAANENDARWATNLADSFAKAGGEGAVSTVSDAALAAALAAAGVDETRNGLTIDPPTAAGAIPSSGYADDPVNTATGNFIEPETDLRFAGAASNLLLSRMYNSLASGLETPGVFGPGWASVLDQHLVLSDDGCRWVVADGRAVDFPRQGDGWDRAVGENYWLTREPASTPALAELTSAPEGSDVLVVRNNQGSWWAYSLAGIWLGTGAGPGRTVSVTRETTPDGGAGRVTRLAHVRGRFLNIDYVDGLAAVVRASDGRRAEYGYDADGRLVSVTTETGTRTYRWNEQGLIDAVYSAAGVLEAENTYDDDGRVILQITQHGRRTRFAYLPGRVTAVSDEDGTRSNSWIADKKGRLVGVLDSHDERQSMSYDGHGNLVSITERDGSVTVNAYDGRGRKTRTVTPEGADLTYGWDEQDRITTLVTETGSVIAYEYADGLSRDPSVIVDPLGGRTELQWQEGLLIRITDPTGVTVEFEYDAFGDLVSTRNTIGDTARIIRDQAGRVVAVIRPSGAQSNFGYDGAGLLIRREDPDGAVWSFEHDSAGRITASVAPDGGTTQREYAANGELLRTVDPMGRSMERVVDEMGNLEAALLPDGTRWGFTHDTLSRLVGITDPAGHDWLREYDKTGALAAVIDPTGVRTEAATDRKSATATVADAFSTLNYTFDQYGRPIRVEAVDGSAELTTYDAAGNPVELLDGEGGLTVLGRDIAGKITSITSPSGAVTRFEYDNCGRPWKTIDPLGSVTELAYNADQQVVARTLPTGEVETFKYDACGRLVLRCTPGRGIARYGYDKAGRLSFTQDSWHGTRRFKYNLAGELTETTNGVGGRTKFEYDLRGRLIRVTDPLGGATEHSYTATNQVESITDPLGRVTTATYDPAGRQLSQTDPDGHTTTWTYDSSGREITTSFDGTLLATIDRNMASRRVVISDYTGPDGLVTDHELGFDRRGLLTSRTRGGELLSWEYDADGRRTGFTDAYGTSTTYGRDAAGRVNSVINPRLGKSVFAYDPCGRLTAVTAGQLLQEWTYRHGYLAQHTRMHRPDGENEPAATDITVLGRDEDGRITELTRAGAVTKYGYDGAGQLASASTSCSDTSGMASVGAAVSEWQYDDGGRLVRESTPAGVRTYSYDAAGQLLAVTDPDGARTEYGYDGLGRRSRLIRPDGSWTEYSWGATGRLKGTTDRTRDGMETSRHELWVDALGELAAVDGSVMWWDSTTRVPTLAGIETEQVLSLPGGVTGIGDAWTSPGWRAARPTDEADPWALLGTPRIPEPASAADAATGPDGVLPAGIRLTGNGGLDIAGLEWLGRRAYDPATRGFLSTDPLAPVLGTGWDGNPYAYAGNNPLNATDPTGLRPLNDADLKAFQAANQGNVTAWWDEYGDYVVGGVIAAAGVGLMFVPGGQGLGMALIGAGADAVYQKITTGTVDWQQVAITGVVGVVAGPVAGKISGAISTGVGKAAATQMGTAITTKVGSAVTAGATKLGPKVGGYVTQLPGREMAKDLVSETVSGGVNNAAVYAMTTDFVDWKWQEFGATTASGLVSGGTGSQSAHLGVNLNYGPGTIIQLGADAAANVAGSATENAIMGDAYTMANIMEDAAVGAGVSYFGDNGGGAHALQTFVGEHSDAATSMLDNVRDRGN